MVLSKNDYCVMLFILEQGQKVVETRYPAPLADHFYSLNYALDNSWHGLSLGYNPSVSRTDIAMLALNSIFW